MAEVKELEQQEQTAAPVSPKNKKKKRKKLVRWIIVLVILAALIFGAVRYFGKGGEPEMQVVTDFVTYGAITSTVEGSGLTKSKNSETLMLTTEGVVQEVFVTEGQKVMDSAYLAQFLGKKLPLTLGSDVDAVAGATATSQAIVDALNLLAPDYDNAAAPVISQRSVTKATAHIQTIQGHDSRMKVIVYLNPEGKVTQVKVQAEGEGNGQAVMSSEFTSQFVGHDSEITLGVEVDAVTGATETSQAVVDAVNNIIR